MQRNRIQHKQRRQQVARFFPLDNQTVLPHIADWLPVILPQNNLFHVSGIMTLVVGLHDTRGEGWWWLGGGGLVSFKNIK